jgi:hypothetical protein
VGVFEDFVPMIRNRSAFGSGLIRFRATFGSLAVVGLQGFAKTVRIRFAFGSLLVRFRFAFGSGERLELTSLTAVKLVRDEDSSRSGTTNRFMQAKYMVVLSFFRARTPNENYLPKVRISEKPRSERSAFRTSVYGTPRSGFLSERFKYSK